MVAGSLGSPAGLIKSIICLPLSAFGVCYLLPRGEDSGVLIEEVLLVLATTEETTARRGGAATTIIIGGAVARIRGGPAATEEATAIRGGLRRSVTTTIVSTRRGRGAALGGRLEERHCSVTMRNTSSSPLYLYLIFVDLTDVSGAIGAGTRRDRQYPTGSDVVTDSRRWGSWGRGNFSQDKAFPAVTPKYIRFSPSSCHDVGPPFVDAAPPARHRTIRMSNKIVVSGSPTPCP